MLPRATMSEVNYYRTQSTRRSTWDEKRWDKEEMRWEQMRRDGMRKEKKNEKRWDEKIWDEKEMKVWVFCAHRSKHGHSSMMSCYIVCVMSLSCLDYQKQHVLMRSLLLTRKLRVNLACSDDMFSVSGTTWLITIPKCIETECSLMPSCFLPLLKALHIWRQNKVWPSPSPPPCSSVKLHALVTLDNISILSSQVSHTPTLNLFSH